MARDSGTRVRALAAAVMAAAAGCADGDPGAPTGRQAVSARDVSNVFFWGDRTVGFTRATVDASQVAPHDLWIWPIDEVTPELALTGVDWTIAELAYYVVGELMLTGDDFERLYDLGSRRAANLATDFLPPADGGDELIINGLSLQPFTELRSDGGALVASLRGTSDSLITGRLPDLQTFAVPDRGLVGGAAFLGADLALLTMHPSDAGLVTGIYGRNMASGTMTTLVPPTPAAEWFGVTGFCENSSCGQFHSFGCDLDQPPCPDGSAPSCILVYTKLDPDDAAATATYLYDVNQRTIAKLAGRNHDHVSFRRESHLLAWGSTFEPSTHFLNTCNGVVGHCAFSPGDITLWRPDGGAFVAWEFLRGFNIVNVNPPSCVGLSSDAVARVFQMWWTPAGDRLLWLADDPNGAGRRVWMAGASGESPVSLATGPLLSVDLSPDGDRLFLVKASSLVAGSTSSLSWLDLTVAPPSEQVLSSNVGGPVIGNRRVAFTDHWNTQDGNGELILVDLTTGTRTSLARAVTEMTAAGDLDAEGTDLAYVVRNRGASARDGLWLTALPP